MVYPNYRLAKINGKIKLVYGTGKKGRSEIVRSFDSKEQAHAWVKLNHIVLFNPDY